MDFHPGAESAAGERKLSTWTLDNTHTCSADMSGARDPFILMNHLGWANFWGKTDMISPNLFLLSTSSVTGVKVFSRCRNAYGVVEDIITNAKVKMQKSINNSCNLICSWSFVRTQEEV